MGMGVGGSSARQSPAGEHLLLYDGVCGLCNRLARFVLTRDSRRVFVFASLQSSMGQTILTRFERNPADLDTVCLVRHYLAAPSLFVKSSAILEVARELGWPWRLFTVFVALPVPMRDWIYDRVADNRYRIFGRYDTCRIPTAEERSRFIDV
jgi:predicted DCC family thiol-disulfide oxidoreductase YuxK